MAHTARVTGVAIDKGRGLIALGGVAPGLLHMWLCQGHSTVRHVVRDTAAKASYIPGRRSTWRRPGYNILYHIVPDRVTPRWNKLIRHDTRHRWGHNSLPHASRGRTQRRRGTPD
jgi:hypothetical protein